MQWPVKETMDANTEMRNAAYPAIRLFSVTRTTAFSPAADCNGRWVECSPETVGDFSAVAYFFGRELYKELKQPVGLIHSSWSGTIADTWMSAGSLRTNPDFVSILQRHEEMIQKYRKVQADYDKSIQRWKEDVNSTQKTGKPQRPKPAAPCPLSPNGASLLFNGMIAPLVPFAIKGVIWYQGESNVNRAKQYQTLFPSLISDWRTQWNQGDFPFLFVQLANFKVPPTWYDSIVWAELREAQLKTLSVPNTGMAITIDIGDANAIHPKNKQEVGRRLALWAMAKTYGHKGLQYSGPMYKNMKVEGNKIILQFDTDCKATDDQLKWFTIAGADRKFVPAQAKIRTDDALVERNAQVIQQMVTVWSPNVNEPVAVRYAWSDNPENCTLYGKTGLPASPFRTDDWPGITDNNK
jgi:sialate O-acetylesterase